METIAVRDVCNPLPEIRQHLQAYSRTIVTAGLGRRRRDDELEPEVVLKVLVKQKRDPLPRNVRRVPKTLCIEGKLLGQPVAIRLRTDVESVPEAVPSTLAIGPPAGQVNLGCYVRWTERGRERRGCLTSGHSLWRTPASTRHASRIDVHLPTGCDPTKLRANVRAASHLARDHVDVALLEFPPLPGGLHKSCLLPVYAGTVTVMPTSSLLAHLGDTDDTLAIPISFRHFDVHPRNVQSVAYYDEFPLHVGDGWGDVILKDVVESESPTSTFQRGTSGSSLVTIDRPREALALQSLSLDPSSHSRSLATSLDCALRWIRERLGIVPEPLWAWPESTD